MNAYGRERPKEVITMDLQAFLEIMPISQVRELLRTVEDKLSHNPDNEALWAYHRIIRQVLGFDE